MNAARTLLQAKEQDPPSGATNIRNWLNSLGIFLEALWRFHDAMGRGIPLSDVSEILELPKAPLNRHSSGVANTGYPNIKFFAREEVPRVVSAEMKTSMSGVFGSFRIEATPVLNGSRVLGWRITSNDQTTSIRHEFMFLRVGYITCSSNRLRPGTTRLNLLSAAK